MLAGVAMVCLVGGRAQAAFIHGGIAVVDGVQNDGSGPIASTLVDIVHGPENGLSFEIKTPRVVFGHDAA